MYKKYFALLSVIALTACQTTTIQPTPNSTTSTSVSEASKNETMNDLQFDLPENWKKSEPQSDGPYSAIQLTSPDYQHTLDGTMCGETKGAEIVITATKYKAGMKTIDEKLRGESESEATISDIKKVSVDNRPAVEYVWSWECSPRLITETDYKGIRYSIYLDDAEKRTEYSSQYYGIINSIRFAK